MPEISTTPGAISALRTGDAGERRYLQITNSLNPGNSGGPLVDRDGFALGVISMKLAGSSGIGFAIPVNALKDFLESRGVDQLMPARRLRLGPVQNLEAKAIRIRMAEGMAYVSAFRSHVETDARAAEIALRIDRVFSPWNLTQLEQALINSPTFERQPMSPESRKSSRLSNPPMIVGRISDGRDDGSSATQMAYGVMDLGREKLVARDAGRIEQMAFNESVLRQSLASLEGQRSLLTDTVAVDAVKWARAPAANGSGLVPLPSGWAVEPGGPSPCSACRSRPARRRRFMLMISRLRCGSRSGRRPGWPRTARLQPVRPLAARWVVRVRDAGRVARRVVLRRRRLLRWRCRSARAARSDRAGAEAGVRARAAGGLAQEGDRIDAHFRETRRRNSSNQSSTRSICGVRGVPESVTPDAMTPTNRFPSSDTS